ncbi:37 kDa salivary gland allergen Aed a 2-like [Anopheles marshallii]|uniref:37 kDa salivary gland allergen Aed a 2-like n=1 Tax=Anopheles marshallii TaxID=1521116 RepID=UPI00237BCA27|nr:37 kDa salivary gland allergen Aed a 2-like [Anopheles marshallii]
MMKKILLSIGLVWCLISLGQARKESTVEECEKNIADSLKDRVCELRQYTPVSSDDMDNHMQCVLEVVGFVNENGGVKENELLTLLQRVDSSVDHAANMRKCETEASTVGNAKKANTFYTCFLGTSSSAGFKNAVDYNELLRAGKMQQSDPFDMGRVSALIKEIDDGLCK